VLTGRTRLVGLIGNPVAASLSPAMQNAAFAACRLDWAYLPLQVENDRVEEALRGLVALGFSGANVTAPHKLEVARICGSSLRSVNTLVVREGRIESLSTDAAILGGLTAERPAILGDGGSAAAFREALPDARVFSRRGEWPPDVADADLVIHATSERDEPLVSLSGGQTLVDLPYPETATARAAREGGATVVTGVEVLVAQGAASFELWTGVPAPVEAMRAAVGLPIVLSHDAEDR
jgi:shikimate dehydrogenase